MIGSNEFAVSGETITLQFPSIRHNGETYVPIPFFREIFGGSASVNGALIHISV